MTNLETAVKNVIEENGGEEFTKIVLKYGCGSGAVPQLIYFNQTYKWFDVHYDDIMELKEKYEELTGDNIYPEGDMKNFFSWFSFDIVTSELYN